VQATKSIAEIVKLGSKGSAKYKAIPLPNIATPHSNLASVGMSAREVMLFGLTAKKFAISCRNVLLIGESICDRTRETHDL